MKKQKQRIPISRMIPDEPREVLRAHTIADTLRALMRHGALPELQNDVRDAVAAELGVPALWIEAAIGDLLQGPCVSLPLLHDWREWEARVLRAGKEA